jgi:hypothetical protein
MKEDEILDIISDLEHNMYKAEEYLSTQEYIDYCDNTSTLIEYWKQILNKIKENGTQS